MALNIPTMAEVAAERAGKPIPKGASRLQEGKAEKKLTVVDERKFLKEVRARDHMHCRKCKRKVVVVLDNVPERAEVHHIHGRLGDLRFLALAALLLCNECHEKCTGRVAEKWIIVATKTFTLLNGEVVTDARKPVRFQRVA